MTKDKLYRDKDLGMHAELLRDNALLKAVLEGLEREAIDAVRTVDPKTQDQVCALIAARADLNAVTKFRDRIATFIANGKIAARELDNPTKG